MENKSKHKHDGDSGYAMRVVALEAMERMAPGLLQGESRKTWMKIVFWKLTQVNMAARNAASEERAFHEYLDTNEVRDSGWVFGLEMALGSEVSNVREVLREVFAIAKKILVEGNGGAKLVSQPGWSQS